MSAPTHHRIAANGKPVRPFVLPATLAGKLKVWRLLILRRIAQLSILLLFFGTARWGWNIAGTPLLKGNLSSSELLGTVPLADPYAVTQILASGHWLQPQVLIGAVIILLFYGLLGGRAWCSWACPVNMVTDLASWLRRRLKITDAVRISRSVRYWILALSLLLSFATGVAAFEWISPISMLHRELIFGIGLGWAAVAAIFLFDLLVIKHGWCGHLCPLGAFYALLGKLSPLRIGFDAPTCTQCCECVHVCPEPQIFDFKQAQRQLMISASECSNCGRCISVCPEDTLRFALRPRIHPQPPPLQETHQRRSP